MRRYIALVLLAALAALVFAPAAMAQQMKDDKMMMEDDQMMQDDMMSSASASASPGASATMSASASALPKTGGTPLLPPLSGGVLAVIVGSGIVAARLLRSYS